MTKAVSQSEVPRESRGVFARKVVPAHLAHLVLRTNRVSELTDWYQFVFQAEIAFRNEKMTFLYFDNEHHRIGIGQMPDLTEPKPKASGIDHVAFSFKSLGDLMYTYERLKSRSILPFYCIDHGPSVSLYYRDPDSNQVEFQVDNYSDREAALAFFASQEFADNQAGIEFDPDVVVKLIADGVPEKDLLRGGSSSIAQIGRAR